jgi:rubrerythrin
MNDLNFAIKMENDGEKYYREQAEINKNNALHSVCLKMADDEKMHAKFIMDYMNEMPVELESMNALENAENVFKGLKDMKTEGIETLNQFDFYRKAVDIEQKSIALYTEYAAKAKNDKERELFELLINQEKQHFEVLEELSDMIRHSMELQDSAEFGIRPQY